KRRGRPARRSRERHLAEGGVQVAKPLSRPVPYAVWWIRRDEPTRSPLVRRRRGEGANRNCDVGADSRPLSICPCGDNGACIAIEGSDGSRNVGTDRASRFLSNSGPKSRLDLRPVEKTEASV